MNAEYKEPTTKNDLGVDAVSKKAVLNTLERMDKALDEDRTIEAYKELLIACYHDLPSVTPQLCEDAVSRQAVLDLIADYDLSMGQVVRGIHALPSVTPQEPKWLKSELIKLIDKTYEDFNNAPGGETWCKIDGKEYYSDMGYAFEGISMFVDVLKSRIEDLIR